LTSSGWGDKVVSEREIKMNQTEQIKAALGMIKAIADAIKELKSVPSGNLYAQICSKVELTTYEKIINTLKRSGLITVDRHHMITWTGSC
jgi:hypothetical protein